MNSHCYLSMSLLFYVLFYLAILATTLVNACLLLIICHLKGVSPEIHCSDMSSRYFYNGNHAAGSKPI